MIPVEPTRRRAMSAIAGAAFAGTALVIAMPDAPAAETPDAELLGLAAQFEAAARRYNSLWHWRVAGGHLETATYVADDDARDAAAEPHLARMADLADQMAANPPVTPAGCQALARCIVLSAGDIRDAVQAGEGDADYLGFTGTEWSLTITLLRGLGAAAVSDQSCACSTMRFVADGAA